MNIIKRKSYSAFTGAEPLKRSSTFANSIIDLDHKKYIRKFFAAVLLATFMLSNTPTKYLHRLFANHKDFVSKTLTDSNTPQFNVNGINCHCETNVVIAPYTGATTFEVKTLLSAFVGYTVSTVDKIFFSQKFSFGLRGPPSIA
ncbi:MAG: hypothetical protein ACTHOB_11465 [Ginsengibacter sp.]